ncbi:hypothetical protein [Halomonas sp. PR-M31]|uniref:hypothetical protein n=1 Tax=Halomonas sp. PR-M31 TaxID=1471202 RepID=UPI00065257BF|nr:hypothetical protein [Halomonas sp. PR-M31]
MPSKNQLSSNLLSQALSRYRDGHDPKLIELPEQAVFPGLIPAAPTTGRKSRCTGILLGRPAPRFVKRNRAVFYRLKDVLDWLENADDYGSTAEVVARSGEAK